MATRATLRGDVWVINGQKVWTSLAQHADWIFVLARSMPESQRHAGLSYLLVPMDQPGIEIRPIVQVTGGVEFNETFFDGAVTEAGLVVGGEGNGWKVAMGTLAFERGASTLGQQTSFRQELDSLVAEARASGRIDCEVLRSDLVQCHIELEILRYNQLRLLASLTHDAPAGPEQSIGKLYWASWHRRLGELAMRVRGAASMVADGDGGAHAGQGGLDYPLDRWQRTFLYSRAHTIYGGSNQIQRNIIGERVLGLPREPR